MDTVPESMKRQDKSDASSSTGETAGMLLTREILEGIDPDNVQRKGPCCKILLGNDWPAMLGSLPALGEALIITGNTAAVLGCTRTYPELMSCPAGSRASSHDGSFDMEFVPWDSARFVSQCCQHMAAYYIEFADCTGTVMHRLCLTEHSDKDYLVDWVQTHQSSGRDATPLTPFPSSRWHTVQQRHWFDYEDVTELPASALLETLQHAIQSERLINVVVGNEGVVQSGEFIPRQVHELPRWTFVSNDTLGLHFDISAISDSIIHRTLLPGGAGYLDALKCFDDDGALRLAIAAPGEAAVEDWNQFLQEAARNSQS